MTDAKLTLYHSPWCGYCRLVRSQAKRLGVPLELVDINKDRQALERLVEARGRQTVPVLGIATPERERLMGESADIIRFLKTVA